MIVPATLFDNSSFNYIGPIDGSRPPRAADSDASTEHRKRNCAARNSCTSSRRRGKATSLAEADPVLYHGPGKFNPAEGIKPSAALLSKKTYYAGVRRKSALRRRRAGFARRRHHARDARRLGHGRVREALRFRYFDVGIAEQHAVTFGGRSRRRRHETGGRDLFDVLAARLRSGDSRRRAPEPCQSCSPLTAPGLSAPMARRTQATTISFLRAAFRTSP